MPSIDRTTILTGPALVQFGGQSFWSRGDVTVSPRNKRFDIQTAHFGKVDERFADRSIEVSFEPCGMFSAALAAVLWPYAATAMGSSIFGASDAQLIIWSRDGAKLTLPNAAITKMPAIRMGTDKTMMGQMTFTGLLANETDPSAAGAYYTLASATYPGDSGFDASKIYTGPWSAAWGFAPWDDILTEAGWEIDFNLGLRPQMVDGLGTIDMTLASLDVSAKAIPVGPTLSAMLAALVPAADFGGSLVNQLAIPASITVTGTLTSDGSTPVTVPSLPFQGFSDGRPFYQTGTDNCTWVGGAVAEWTLSAGGGTWVSSSDVATPDLAAWSAVSPATGTPVFTGVGNIAPDLILTHGDITISVANAVIVDGSLTYDAEKKRLAQAEWIATRRISAGVAVPLFAISES